MDLDIGGQLPGLITGIVTGILAGTIVLFIEYHTGWLKNKNLGKYANDKGYNTPRKLTLESIGDFLIDFLALAPLLLLTFAHVGIPLLFAVLLIHGPVAATHLDSDLPLNSILISINENHTSALFNDHLFITINQIRDGNSTLTTGVGNYPTKKFDDIPAGDTVTYVADTTYEIRVTYVGGFPNPSTELTITRLEPLRATPSLQP